VEKLFSPKYGAVISVLGEKFGAVLGSGLSDTEWYLFRGTFLWMLYDFAIVEYFIPTVAPVNGATIPEIICTASQVPIDFMVKIEEAMVVKRKTEEAFWENAKETVKDSMVTRNAAKMKLAELGAQHVERLISIEDSESSIFEKFQAEEEERWRIGCFHAECVRYSILVIEKCFSQEYLHNFETLIEGHMFRQFLREVDKRNCCGNAWNGEIDAAYQEI